MRWARAGVWERIFADLVGDKKNQYLMIDSTIVRAHQQATAGRKRGLRRPSSGALPRWTEQQDPPAGRRSGTAGRLPHHWRPGGGVRSGDPVAGRPAGRGRARRQGIRLGPDRRQGAEPRRSRRHPVKAAPQAASHLRPRTLQTAQPHRTLLQQAQALPTLQHPILLNHRSLPSMHRSRMRLDQTSAICGYSLRARGDLLGWPIGRKWRYGSLPMKAFISRNTSSSFEENTSCRACGRRTTRADGTPASNAFACASVPMGRSPKPGGSE
jgi:hypothetical protein